MQLKRIGSCHNCPTKITARSKSGLCGQCNRRQPKNSKRPFEWVYMKLLRSAALRGIPVTLSFEEFLGFTEIPCCRYCNGEVTWVPHSHWGPGPTNLDRLNNAKGYEKGNLAVCCHHCNTKKSDWLSSDEFQLVNDLLRTYRNTDDVGRKELQYTIVSWNDSL